MLSKDYCDFYLPDNYKIYQNTIFMKKIVNAIHSFYKRNDFQKAIIGLSGGIDSSVTAALLVKSLGKENVLGAYLPCGNQNDLADVKALCKLLKIKFLVIDISPAFIAINKVLNNHDKLVKANIASRLRMVHLYALANQNKGFVCGTTNKADMNWAISPNLAMVPGIEPLLNLYKSQNHQLPKIKYPQIYYRQSSQCRSLAKSNRRRGYGCHL